MSERKSRPLWPLLTAALIGLPVLYVASFGPACWLDQRYGVGRPVISIVYRPVFRLMLREPLDSHSPVQKALVWHICLGQSRLSHPVLSKNGDLEGWA